MQIPAAATFEAQGWRVHPWQYAGQDATVLHREPFRLRWMATQLVTFVYLLRRTPESYQQVQDDYEPLLEFAKQHKRTLLPRGFQCGFALLPIYIGEGFSESLVADVSSKWKKRWCSFHCPSLLDASTGQLTALEGAVLWGGIYRKFIRQSVTEVAETITRSETPA